ncbi:MAG: DNA-processing protein DprA [Desulfovibrio aminophilus]|uniref:DNA-processing protein DprA n=1 Tax=Desulfovibrio aminophilus TaxID=81425 RepID=UPI0039ED09D8
MSTGSDQEFFASLALRHCPGIGSRRALPLLRAYGSAYAAVRDASSWTSRGLLAPALSRAFLREEWRPAAESEYRAARAASMERLTWADPRYPARLRELSDAPLLLYCQGDVALLGNPSVAVVGARACTNMGLRAAEIISTGLSALGITVVSGLAEGIDRQAHLGGLSGLGSSIAVLGAGLDQDYPPRNADLRAILNERGLVVTEFGPGVEPRPSHFPVRNRIISGLSLGVVVAEAAAKSGSLITARLALEQGREVFALPGPLGQPSFVGCLDLLKQGAILVEKAEDIVEALRFPLRTALGELPDPRPDFQPPELPPARLPEVLRPVPRPVRTAKRLTPPPPTRPAPAPPANLPPLERRLLDVLKRERKTHIDELCRLLDLGSAEVGSALLLLEMKNLVRQWPGMSYTLFEDDGAYGS